MTEADREQLKRDLMRDEGVRLKPYTDTVGKLTIGVGRNLTDKGISHDEAQFLLENDMDESIRDCQGFAWFKSLNGVRQRVIVNMHFNLGPVGLRKFSGTLGAVMRGDYEQAATNMLKSKWAGQVGRRATRLASMMRTGKEQP